jgi:hypothetical protein
MICISRCTGDRAMSVAVAPQFQKIPWQRRINEGPRGASPSGFDRAGDAGDHHHGCMAAFGPDPPSSPPGQHGSNQGDKLPKPFEWPRPSAVEGRPTVPACEYQAGSCADPMGRAARIISIGADVHRATEPLVPRQRKPNDLSRSLITLDMDTTLIAVVELSLSSWLVAGIVPGVEL